MQMAPLRCALHIRDASLLKIYAPCRINPDGLGLAVIDVVDDRGRIAPEMTHLRHGVAVWKIRGGRRRSG